MKLRMALRSRQRWLWQLGIPLLLIISAVIWYFKTAPQRAEQTLKQASLLELQVESQQDANNPRVFYYLGQRAQEAGQKQLALTSFQQAATLAPNDEATWLTWARAAAALQGSLAAINILNTFLQVHPHSVGAHLMLAQIFSELDDTQHAYAEAKTAAQQDPHNDRAWRLSGSAALRNQDFYAAEDAFRHAIALTPGDWENQQGLGDALSSSSRYPEAIKYYREAVRLAPSAGVTHLTLGEALMHTANAPADYDAARDSLRQALAQQGTLTSDGLFMTYLSLGQSYVLEGRWQEALPWLQQAVPYEPKNVLTNDEVHFELARAYRGLHDAASAAREMSLHTERMRYNVQIRKLSGRIHADPNDVQAYLSLARLYAAHGDDSAAAYLYRQVLTRSPAWKSAQQEFAALLRRQAATGSQGKR
jgi:tetratricopeptide (TPR) repeat protein